MNIDKQAVGQRIRDLRQAHGLSMAALATEIGTASKSTVNDWEKGRSLASSDKLAAIAQRFKTSTGFLLHGDLTDYTRGVLQTDGINNPEFNVLLWEYVDLTTTNPNLLSGDVFNTEPTEKPAHSIIDQHITAAIDQILPTVVHEFSANEYPDAAVIIQSTCDVFRHRIQLIRQTFTGKYNRIVRMLDNVDLYEKLGTEPELAAYLNEVTGVNGGYAIDRDYQAQLNQLMATFHQQLNTLNGDYQRALRRQNDDPQK